MFQLVTYDKLKKEMVGYLRNFAITDFQASYNWFKITERLGCLQKFFTTNKNIYSNSLIRFILSKARIFLDELDSPIYKNKTTEDMSDVDAKKYVIDRLIEGRIHKFFKENDNSFN